MSIFRRLICGAAMAASAFLATSALAQEQAVKVGIIGPFSGPFAHYGSLFKAGAEAYVASQGGKLGGKQVELIYRDTGGPNPAQTRVLAQELIVKEKVDSRRERYAADPSAACAQWACSNIPDNHAGTALCSATAD